MLTDGTQGNLKNLQDLMNILRDHYEGTELDKSKLEIDRL